MKSISIEYPAPGTIPSSCQKKMPVLLRIFFMTGLLLIALLILGAAGELLFGTGVSPAREASALETDFRISNESLTRESVTPGESSDFNITIQNIGEHEEFYRIRILQDFSWTLEIMEIVRPNGTLLSYQETSEASFSLLNATLPGEHFFLVGRIISPAFRNNISFSSRETIEELGIYAHWKVSFTIRVMASSDNFATRKDTAFQLLVEEFHTMVSLSDRNTSFISRNTLQALHTIRVTHVTNLFESSIDLLVNGTVFASKEPVNWEAELSLSSLLLAPGEMKETILFINASAEELELEDPFYYDTKVVFRENIHSTGQIIPFKTMVPHEGKFEFVADENNKTKYAVPGTAVSFDLGVRNTGKGIDSVKVIASARGETLIFVINDIEPAEVRYIAITWNLEFSTDLRAGDAMELLVVGESFTTPEFSESLTCFIVFDTFYGFQFPEDYQGYATPAEPATYPIAVSSNSNTEQTILFSRPTEVLFTTEEGAHVVTLLATDWNVKLNDSLVLQPGETGYLWVEVQISDSGEPDDSIQMEIWGTVNGFSKSVTITTIIKPYRAIEVEFPGEEVLIPTATDTDVSFILRNTGNIATVIQMNGSCLDSDFNFFLNTNSEPLEPHEDVEIIIKLTIPTKEEGYRTELTIFARTTDGSAIHSATVTLVVRASNGVVLQLVENEELLKSIPGEKLVFHLNLLNIGNSKDRFILVSTTPGLVVFSDSSVILEPFASTVVTVEGTIPLEYDSGLVFEEFYYFNITAISDTNNTRNDTILIPVTPLILSLGESSNMDQYYYSYQTVSGYGRTVAEVQGYCLRGKHLIYKFHLVNIHTEDSQFTLELSKSGFLGVEITIEAVSGEDPEQTGVPGQYEITLTPFQSQEFQLRMEVFSNAARDNYSISLTARYSEGLEILEITTFVPRFDLVVADLELDGESFEGRTTNGILKITLEGTLTGVEELDTASNVWVEVEVSGRSDTSIIKLGTLHKGETKTAKFSWKAPELEWLTSEGRYEVTVWLVNFVSYQAEFMGQGRENDDNSDNDEETFYFDSKDASAIAQVPGTSNTNVFFGIFGTSIFFCLVLLFSLKRGYDFRKRKIAISYITTNLKPFYPLGLCLGALLMGLIFSLPSILSLSGAGRGLSVFMVLSTYIGLFFFGFWFSYRARNWKFSLLNGTLPFLTFIFMVTIGSGFAQFLEVFFLEVHQIYIPLPSMESVPLPNLVVVGLCCALNVLAYHWARKSREQALKAIGYMSQKEENLKGRSVNDVFRD